MLAVQLGASCVLLVLTGWMLRSFHRMISDRSVDAENVALLSAPLKSYGTQDAEAVEFWRLVRDSLATHSAVDGIALVSRSPVSQGPTTTTPEAQGQIITLNEVDGGFFKVMRMPILAGRTFEAADTHATSVILSRRLAVRMYGTLNVIGQGFPKATGRRSIVGVVEDTRSLNDPNASSSDLYAPLEVERTNPMLLVRARNNPASLLPLMRETARNSDPRVIADAHLLSAEFDRREGESRALSIVLSILGGLALIISCVGIIGTVSYAATSRRREIGIRFALGADRRSVILRLVRQVIPPLCIGILLGLIGTIPFGRMFAGSPFFIRPFDFPVFFIVVLVLTAITGAAATWPAWRAVRSNPVDLLRNE